MISQYYTDPVPSSLAPHPAPGYLSNTSLRLAAPGRSRSSASEAADLVVQRVSRAGRLFGRPGNLGDGPRESARREIGRVEECKNEQRSLGGRGFCGVNVLLLKFRAIIAVHG